MKKHSLFILLFCIAASLQAQQSYNLSGVWTGVVTQNAGGYRSEYKITLTLAFDGNTVMGISYCAVDDIFVKMSIHGQLIKKRFMKIEDMEMLDYKIVPNLQWCDKTYQLIYKPETDTIDGFWQGVSSDGPCIPGKVHLKRKVNRA